MLTFAKYVTRCRSEQSRPDSDRLDTPQGGSLQSCAEISEDGDLRLLEFDNIQAAIGMHICELQRPLGPREIRFLRGEMGFSQTDLGVALGYRDKQRVLSAEKLSEDRKPLNTPADMLLRNHYLGMIGKHDLVGDDYRNAAIAMSEALNRPMQPVDDTDHLVAA